MVFHQRQGGIFRQSVDPLEIANAAERVALPQPVVEAGIAWGGIGIAVAEGAVRQ